MELRPTRRLRRARGMAMVEMVFVLPLLLLLLFAIAEFGLMFSRWLTLSNAVREGARTAVVFRDPASCNEDDVKRKVREAVRSYAAAGGVALEDGEDGDIEVDGACGGTDNPARVSATYPFQLRIPFASRLGEIELAYESTMRNE